MIDKKVRAQASLAPGLIKYFWYLFFNDHF